MPVVGAVSLVQQTDKQIDRAVVVNGAEHVVEVDRAVEKAPADVAHQGSEERLDVHQVASARIEDMGEVLVALETELPGGERLIAQIFRVFRLVGNDCGGGAHGISCFYAVWQISAHFSTVWSPLIVCSNKTPGAALRN